MRILAINPPLVRHKALGACEQDRLTNLHDLVHLGHTVRLLTRSSRLHTAEEAQQYHAARGFEAHVYPYRVPRQKFAPSRFADVAFFDGAAWDMGTPDFLAVVDQELRAWKPDLVWCHASYNWAPAIRAKRLGIPTVVRSVNYEPLHMLQEDGRSLANWLRYLGKYLGERRAVRHASVLAAITPDEQAIYRQFSPTPVELLPLRTLPALLRPARPATDSAANRPLRLFFMGASYNVSHNRNALNFVVRELVPRLRQAAPGQFEVHLMGGKIPEAVNAFAAPDLVIDGFVEDLEAHLASMDVALMPSLSGCGMQQKIFESLCRGFPTITNRRALAGYDFESGIHLLTAENVEEYTAALLSLRDPVRRRALSERAAAQANALFSQSQIDARVTQILNQAVGRRSSDPVSAALASR